MRIIYHLLSLISQIKTYIKIKVFQKRFFFLNKTGKKFYFENKVERVFVVIAHVVPDIKNADDEKLNRLINCLDCMEKSLAGYVHKITLLSKEGYSLVDRLPKYLQDRIDVFYSSQQDPMYVEFDAHNIFEADRESFDYFIFLEDDILLNDSWFLEKIKKFNAISPFKEFVLLPHRYEYFDGVKYYLDQMAIKGKPSKRYTYSDVLNVDLDGIEFCIYENPHAAFYCLSAMQLDRWIKSGYNWRNKVVAFGPLESAATFSMYENFKFIKPSPNCLEYFEVQHFGNKYILNDQVLLNLA